jgi:hypothetical protein
VLREAWDIRALRLGGPAGFVALVILAFALRPAMLDRWFRRLVIIMSPVSLIVIGSLVASASEAPPVVTVESGTVSESASACAPVVAWLFDELSFSYMYDEAGAVRSEFPRIGQFAASATQYLSVTAPARETLVALPSFLAARHLRGVRVTNGGLSEVTDEGLVPFSAMTPDGLFGTARRLGFRTEMDGYYLPYCDLLGGLVDACQSLSFYNASTTRARFSPGAPVSTTLILWPRQFPFGLLKSPPFASLQAALVERTAAFARRPLADTGPVFRFVHFSVPHLPFVYDEDGHHPPFNPLQTSPDEYYVRQLRFVDALFGDLVDQMRQRGTYESTTIVLLADHGFRFGGQERDPLHIPFIVKGAGQMSRVDVSTPIPGEQLLKRVVEQSCPVR